MRTVHKFPLPTNIGGGDIVELQMPAHAVIRRFALQNHVPTLWVEIDDKTDLMPRRFQIFGTDHPLPAHAAYVGTYEQGPFVWHVYQVSE
jgi:hypothetical protein